MPLASPFMGSAAPLSRIARLLERDAATLAWSELHEAHQVLLRCTLRSTDGQALWLLSQFYERGFHVQWQLRGKTRPRGGGPIARWWSSARYRWHSLFTEPVLALDRFLADRYRYAAARADVLPAQLALVEELRRNGDDADHELAYALLKRMVRLMAGQRSAGMNAAVLPKIGLVCLTRGAFNDALTFLEQWYEDAAPREGHADTIAVLGVLYARRWLHATEAARTDHDLMQAQRYLTEAAENGSVLAQSWIVALEEHWKHPRSGEERTASIQAVHI